MSIRFPSEAVSNGKIDATFTDSRQRERSSRESNKNRVKVAYTTRWALQDILEHAQAGREDMRTILRWIDAERMDAKSKYDASRLARLGELSHAVADLALRVGELERLAADAKLGIYEPMVPAGERANGKQ